MVQMESLKKNLHFLFILHSMLVETLKSEIVFNSNQPVFSRDIDFNLKGACSRVTGFNLY